MAGNFNRVFLMGNLTRDVELRQTAGNNAVARIGLAVNRRYTTGDGEKREEVTFVDCEAWGKTAETMSKYLAKGRPVFIEGRLKLDQWEDKTTKEKRSKLVVVVESFQFIDSRQDGGGGGGGGAGAGAGRAPARAAAPEGSQDWGGSGGGQPAGTPMGEDDIPF